MDGPKRTKINDECVCCHCRNKIRLPLKFQAVPSDLWTAFIQAKRNELAAQLEVRQLETWVQHASLQQKDEGDLELDALRDEKQHEQDFYLSQLEFKNPEDISNDGRKVMFYKSPNGYAILDKAFVDQISKDAKTAKELFEELLLRHFTHEALLNGSLDGGCGFHRLNPPMIDAIFDIIHDVHSRSETTSRNAFKESLRRMRERIRAEEA
ncbi:uncharacterized protein LOC135936521 [Cloeon dipterum]|uniref:uncharacterized protein LOC135936521 n=1 Tax=Cloeon dipterum TaxID=197152 RepID=UPI0032202F3B